MTLSRRKTLMKTIFFTKRHCLLMFRQQCVTATYQWRPYNRHHWRAVCARPCIEKTILLQNSLSSFTVHTFSPNFVYTSQIKSEMLDIC